MHVLIESKNGETSIKSENEVVNHKETCDIVIEYGKIHTIEVTVVNPDNNIHIINIENQEEKALTNLIQT